MKAGVKQMKKEYKKINIDKVEDLQVGIIPYECVFFQTSGINVKLLG